MDGSTELARGERGYAELGEFGGKNEGEEEGGGGEEC